MTLLRVFIILHHRYPCSIFSSPFGSDQLSIDSFFNRIKLSSQINRIKKSLFAKQIFHLFFFTKMHCEIIITLLSWIHYSCFTMAKYHNNTIELQKVKMKTKIQLSAATDECKYRISLNGNVNAYLHLTELLNCRFEMWKCFIFCFFIFAWIRSPEYYRNLIKHMSTTMNTIIMKQSLENIRDCNEQKKMNLMNS